MLHRSKKSSKVVIITMTSSSASLPIASNTTSPMRPGLSQAEVEEMRDAFSLFDTKGKGTIQTTDLRQVIGSLGLAESKPNVAHLMRLLEEQNSEVDFDRFVTLLTTRMGDEDDLRRVFDLFDENQTGYITIDDLRKVATDLGETMTEEELQEMIDRADTQEKGKVSPDEFYAIMTKKLFS